MSYGLAYLPQILKHSPDKLLIKHDWNFYSCSEQFSVIFAWFYMFYLHLLNFLLKRTDMCILFQPFTRLKDMQVAQL